MPAHVSTKSLLLHEYIPGRFSDSWDDGLECDSPFASRTLPLSTSEPMVLHGKLCGRVDRCRIN
jgi:hypothetical protein